MTLLKYLYIGIFAATLVLGGIYFTVFNPSDKGDKEYDIKNKWELPKELNEVSGITWLDDGNLACIQDEEGIIFIYNLKDKKITKKIPFGDAGDFEGLSAEGNTIYALRSDGTIFKIENYNEKNINVSEYDTPLSHKNNTESLALDKKNNRLLLAAKDENPGDENYKTIYGFNLNTNRIDSTAILKIDLKSKIFADYEEKKMYKTFRPSEIAINPLTHETYLLEGVRPKLLVVDTEGNPKRIYKLDHDDFRQPEGITFSPEGKLFISNEAGKHSANILEVVLD